MKVDYDAIIVGAGPAGASCAKILTENGINTLIIEKKIFPRYKACGGLISERAMNFINNNFGQIPETIFCKDRFVKCRLSKNGMGYISLPWNFQSLKRHELDYWLWKESKTKTIFGLFVEFYQEKNHITVKYLDNDNFKTLTTKFLIGADGANSFVRKQIDKNYNIKDILICRQEVYSGISDIENGYYNFIMSNKYTDLYACFTKKDNLIYICSLYKFENKHNKLFDNFYERLNKIFSLKLNLIRKEYCFSNTDLNRNKGRFFFGQNNILLCGESTALLNVIGEGITSALFCGKYAAEAILKNGNILNNYLENVKSEKAIIEKTLYEKYI